MSVQVPIIPVVDALLSKSKDFMTVVDAAEAVRAAVTESGTSKLVLKMSTREIVAGRRQCISGLLWIALETNVSVSVVSAEMPVRHMALVS
ncbi:MAG: hypothetical protein JWM52_793 [Candidatus Saccharibacteria bacterium]|nr:hypothetical protein [Candidatus Saccharibacteria bacterium]